MLKLIQHDRYLVGSHFFYVYPLAYNAGIGRTENWNEPQRAWLFLFNNSIKLFISAFYCQDDVIRKAGCKVAGAGKFSHEDTVFIVTGRFRYPGLPVFYRHFCVTDYAFKIKLSISVQRIKKTSFRSFHNQIRPCRFFSADKSKSPCYAGCKNEKENYVKKPYTRFQNCPPPKAVVTLKCFTS